jgi:hypothetical protein
LEEIALMSSMRRYFQGEVAPSATFPKAVETAKATVKCSIVSTLNRMKDCHSYPLYQFMHEELVPLHISPDRMMPVFFTTG